MSSLQSLLKTRLRLKTSSLTVVIVFNVKVYGSANTNRVSKYGCLEGLQEEASSL